MRKLLVTLITPRGERALPGTIENLRRLAELAQAPVREIKSRHREADTFVVTDRQNPEFLGQMENFIRYAEQYECQIQFFGAQSNPAA